MKSRNLFLFAFVVYIVFMLAAIITPTRAQDAEPTAEATQVISLPVVTPAPNDSGVTVDNPDSDAPPVFQAPNPDEVANAAFLALLAAFSTGILSPLTTLLVSLVKRIKLPIIQAATGDQINLAIAVLLSLIMWGANRFGYGPQVTTGYKLLYAVLPILMGIGGSYLSSQAVYNGVKGKMPVVGYQRTPKQAATPLESTLKAELLSIRGESVVKPSDIKQMIDDAMYDALNGIRREGIHG